MDSTKRVGIIGGGIAGLSAAYALHKAGYRQVTVLEAGAEVGGKIASTLIDGQMQELGAMLVTATYDRTRALVDELGLTLIQAPPVYGVDPVGGARISELDLLTGGGGPTELARRARAGAIYNLARQRLADQLDRPGFRGLSPAVCQPFGQWARSFGIQVLEESFMGSHTCCGYGSFAEISASYVLKSVSRLFIRRPGTADDLWLIKGGYQRLPLAIAERLSDVRTGARVERVARGDEVTVTYRQGGELREASFDAVVLALPMAGAAVSLLDATAEEARLFGQLQTYRYAVTLCRAGDTAGPRIDYLILNGSEVIDPPEGVPNLLIRMLDESDVLVVYTQTTRGMGEGEVNTQVEQTLRGLGLGPVQILQTRIWDYFPHVSPSVMAEGWFDAVEALQGQRHTYYTGAQLNFESVECSIAHAQDLVARHFCQGAGAAG